MKNEGDSLDNDISDNSELDDDVAASGKKIHDSKKNKRSAKILGKR